MWNVSDIHGGAISDQKEFVEALVTVLEEGPQILAQAPAQSPAAQAPMTAAAVVRACVCGIHSLA